MLLSDIALILSRPMEAGNVGAVCRAMKNMGLSRLRLVSPEPMDSGIIRARAVHAEDVWETAESFQSLDRAVADCSVAVGVTRRRGRGRKTVTLSPEELASYLRDRPGTGAIVFGNERSGLEAEELGLCGLASHIPADEGFPSLNLSHAVQIYAYQLFRVLGSAHAVEGTWIPMNQAELDSLARRITDSLESLGFYKQPGRAEQERFFRDVCSRAGLSIREGAYMGDIFAKAARLGQKNRF
ncbi:MAG: TrmJ/YjtD family RNA methyltransferase [Spirochaetaceae bacterium]|nr:TrmJ/YjtD family RNA methyltransferase [Spirochaetaceae bacterium]